MILDFFYKPQVALIIFTIFVFGYFIFINHYGGLSMGFLHFGPGTNENNTTNFIGIKLDSWEKVGLLYLLTFITAYFTAHFNTVTEEKLHLYVWNKAITHVPYNKFWTYLITLLEPILYGLMGLINFFTILTLQLQFIIPQFLGAFIPEIPFTFKILELKTFK